MTDPTATARVQRYRASLKDKGLVTVQLVVPEHRADAMREIARLMRVEHEPRGKTDD